MRDFTYKLTKTGNNLSKNAMLFDKSVKILYKRLKICYNSCHYTFFKMKIRYRIFKPYLGELCQVFNRTRNPNPTA